MDTLLIYEKENNSKIMLAILISQPALSRDQGPLISLGAQSTG